jgi:hypothetical protein
VVSAKDDARGLPGGIKGLVVEISPEDEGATLTIRRTQGSTGSAVFQSTGTPTMTVTNGQRVTILGGDVSDRPRNLELEAHIGGVVKAMWSFTVFQIATTAFDAGAVEEVLPPTALKNAGAGGATLLNAYKDTARGESTLGHNFPGRYGPFGGIVIQGRIVPTGMDRHDFNLTHSRTEGFNWHRSISERIYDESGCISVANLEPVKDQQSDDRHDSAEDLLPDNDGSSDDLLIWSVDVPIEPFSAAFARAYAVEGAMRRYRIQFIEQAQYAGVKVSQDLPWYWRFSIQVGPTFFVQNDDYAGDNELKAYAFTPLTYDLGDSSVPDFEVTAFEPTQVTAGGQVSGELTGLNLDVGAPCQPVIHFIRESHTDIRTSISLIDFKIDRLGNTNVMGAFWTGYVAGIYEVKVFIGDKVAAAPDTLTIVDP